MAEQNPGVTEAHHQHEPQFDGGTFTIEFLSKSPDGFEVKTDKSNRRRNQTPKGREPMPLNSQQRIQLKDAMPEQMKFAHGDIAKLALDKLREAREKGENEQTINHLAEDYERKRKIYYDRNFPRVGLKNVRQSSNTLTVDIKPVDFPTSAQFSRPDATSELLEFANISSTSILLTTRDGKLIIQHRSPLNKLYGNVSGTSADGYFDAKPYPLSSAESKAERKGTLQPIDTNFVKDNAIKEAYEEIGIERQDLFDLRILGLSHDKIQFHDDFILLGKTKLSFDEVKEKAKKAEINIELDEEEFYEKFVGIPATPDAISTLISQVKCPIPPNITAVFVAAGYSMLLEEKGSDEASKWKSKMEKAVRKNYQEIDLIVVKHYENHPEVLTQIPQGKPPRNPRGYDPAYLPSEQGLPDLIYELKRVKLILEDTETSPSNEIMKTVDHMLILDVDGVITDPQEKKVTEFEILDQIARKLEKREPVALNTGRSIEWVREKVINPLIARIKDKEILENFLLVGEKGGTWLEFNNQGYLIESKDEDISVPTDLQEIVRNIINTDYSDSMFFDKSKLTMISTEMKDGHSLEDYTEKQKILSETLTNLLTENKLENKFKVDPTTIAVDVENKFVGKHFAVKRILEWVKKRGIKPQKYITFGDSFESDITMAEELYKQGLPVEFVYVGKEDIKPSDYPFPITQAINKYDKGTLEFLESLDK